MNFEKNTQENIDKMIEDIVTKKSPYFSKGLMGELCPKSCKVSLAEKRGEFVFEMTEWLVNPLGIAHGGMLVTLFDTFGGILTQMLTGVGNITTVSIQTTFLKPVQIGDHVHLKIHSTSLGKTLINMLAELYLPNGELAATSTITYYAFKKPLDKRQLEK